MINRYWLQRNKYRLILAAAIGIVAFVVALPAEARLPVGPVTTPMNEMPAPPSCELRFSDLDQQRLVSLIKIEEHKAFDTIGVFYIDEMDAYVTVTSKRDCVVDIH